MTPRARQLLAAIGSAVAVCFYGFFAWAHISNWLHSGEVRGLGFALQETLLVGLFVFRRPAKASSTRPAHWLVGVVGTCTPLLLRPEGTTVLGLDLAYGALQVAGAVLTVACTVSLGRSFGIVAANRGVKVSGAYAFVRHPVYASYLVGHVGYLLSAFTLANAVILAVAWTLQVQRMIAEEAVLGLDEEYRRYASRVRYRLIPAVF